MKKILTLAAIFAVTTLWAQRITVSYDIDLSELVDRSTYYELSREQREKIIYRKKHIGNEFETIGRDPRLSSKEKGIRKRELSNKIHLEIRAILSENQYSKWNSANKNKSSYKGKKHQVNERIEKQLDRLEQQYEADIKKIERKFKHDKHALKREKNKRKELYKVQKDRLKSQKI